MHSLLHRNAEGASWSTTRRWLTLTHELLDRFCIMGLYLGLDNTSLLVAVEYFDLTVLNHLSVPQLWATRMRFSDFGQNQIH